MLRKIITFGVVIALLVGAVTGCGNTTVPDASIAAAVVPNATAAPEAMEESVELVVAGGWPECRALDVVANAFMKQYPNCTITYEYLQDYYAALEKRMGGEAPVDLFFSSNIQADSPMLPYALDLNRCEELDLDNTFDGLIENFTFRENASDTAKLYAIPLGAEMRGMYVNRTLLDSLGIPVPTDQASLLHACEVLKESGYIAFHGNPGTFSQTLLYPWICNLIANADDPAAAHARVNMREPGLSEMFREPYEFLYTLVENGYYDYKRAQTELNLFTDATDEAYARDFLHIQKQGDTDEWKKIDDVGNVAFMPAPMSLKPTIDKTKDDYHSEIEYEFVLSPVGKDGGFAYMSPAHGIAANKDSENLEWSVRFLNYLFTPENNILFTQTFDVIPNTKDAFAYIRSLYDVPDERISHLGEVTFDYGFYNAILPSMVDVSKANNPKYMQDDGNGNLSLYSLDYFMSMLEDSLQQQ